MHNANLTSGSLESAHERAPARRLYFRHIEIQHASETWFPPSYRSAGWIQLTIVGLLLANRPSTEVKSRNLLREVSVSSHRRARTPTSVAGATFRIWRDKHGSVIGTVFQGAQPPVAHRLKHNWYCYVDLPRISKITRERGDVEGAATAALARPGPSNKRLGGGDAVTMSRRRAGVAVQAAATAATARASLPTFSRAYSSMQIAALYDSMLARDLT